MLKYNKEIYKVELGNKAIEFYPWTTRQEKAYLLAKEEKEITNEVLFEILVQPSLVQPYNLSIDEQKMLLIEMRKKGIGETFLLDYKCAHCGRINLDEIAFDSIVKFTPDNFKDIIVQDVTIVLNENISPNLYKRLQGLKGIEYTFIDFLISIKEVIIGEESYSTFTFDELKEFMEDLPTNIFDKLFKEYTNNSSKLKFNTVCTCKVCNEENEIILDSLPNFLWI